MKHPPLLVLGTSNVKKRLELERLLAPSGFVLKTLADFPQHRDVVEDGLTFFDNARKKAVEQATFLNEWVFAEDSGLSVPVLDGRPGVYSARYAGEPCNDEANNDRLLSELDGKIERAAYYSCCVVVADPSGAVRATSEATCWGRITHERRGSGGFGYDPLFEIVEYRHTFGELAPAFKQCISHRARALRQIVHALERLAGERRV
ncbi:MAG: RdgB/HAM1 family non-canonical purine NTP pyrophosphatase [Thermoguttaceae bacterium]